MKQNQWNSAFGGNWRDESHTAQTSDIITAAENAKFQKVNFDAYSNISPPPGFQVQAQPRQYSSLDSFSSAETSVQPKDARFSAEIAKKFAPKFSRYLVVNISADEKNIQLLSSIARSESAELFNILPLENKTVLVFYDIRHSVLVWKVLTSLNISSSTAWPNQHIVQPASFKGEASDSSNLQVYFGTPRVDLDIDDLVPAYVILDGISTSLDQSVLEKTLSNFGEISSLNHTQLASQYSVEYFDSRDATFAQQNLDHRIFHGNQLTARLCSNPAANPPCNQHLHEAKFLPNNMQPTTSYRNSIDLLRGFNMKKQTSGFDSLSFGPLEFQKSVSPTSARGDGGGGEFEGKSAAVKQELGNATGFQAQGKTFAEIIRHSNSSDTTSQQANELSEQKFLRENVDSSRVIANQDQLAASVLDTFSESNLANVQASRKNAQDQVLEQLRQKQQILRHEAHISSCYSQNKPLESNELDLFKILNGEDTRTTFMIRNIPNKYTQQMIKDLLDESHQGTYDFLYLRMDFKNRCNVGYAFVNFIDPRSAVSFALRICGKRWTKFNSEKICSLSYANIQGKEALIAKFRDSQVMLEDPSYRPKIFYTSGPLKGTEQDFPGPTPAGLKRMAMRVHSEGSSAVSSSTFGEQSSRLSRGTTITASQWRNARFGVGSGRDNNGDDECFTQLSSPSPVSTELSHDAKSKHLSRDSTQSLDLEWTSQKNSSHLADKRPSV